MRELADVVFPAEAYPEKEGTLVHPDGRVQRLRPAIGRPRGAGGQPGTGVRPLWQVIADVARALGHDPGRCRHRRAGLAPPVRRPCRSTTGLTLEEIGGRGVRWPERDDVRLARRGSRRSSTSPPARPPRATARCGSAPTARCGRPRRSTSRRRCTSSAPRQVAELSPADAAALGIREGDRVEVGNGTRGARRTVRGCARAVPAGSVFLAEGTREDNANVLTDALVEVHRVGPGSTEPSSIAVQVQPAVEGLAEMPASAPLPIPPREVT